MRSRTGCLTCRNRKLKCDEQKPVCGQCTKASRNCVASPGVVFRHQQNASLNGESGDSSLKSFYGYKETFGKDSIWVQVPKQLTFIHTSNPYEDPGSAQAPQYSQEQISGRPAEQESAWQSSAAFSSPYPASRGITHGLEALSAAASGDHYIRSLQHPGSLSELAQTAADVDYMLNGSGRLSPPIDPQLNNDLPGTSHLLSNEVALTSNTALLEDDISNDSDVPFLVRYFSEGPGAWMDLFDLNSFFAVDVPIKASPCPLLLYASIALSAKALGRIRISSQHTKQPASRRSPSQWSHKARCYYDLAINLLRQALEQETKPGSAPRQVSHAPNEAILSPDPADGSTSGVSQWKDTFPNQGRTKLPGTDSDELVATTAILCVYEFLDASGLEWSRHLDGAKSLFDIARDGSLPPTARPNQSLPHYSSSKGRRAVFWNICRQELLHAFINNKETGLDTSDLEMWRSAGLHISQTGYILPSNQPESQQPMEDDMNSNALIWLTMKLVNFIVAGDDFPHELGLGIRQKQLLEYWEGMERQLDVWYEGLPDSFRPTSTVGPDLSQMEMENTVNIPKKWFARAMCASTMQWYHFAKIQLLANKPHLSTGLPYTASPSGGRSGSPQNASATSLAQRHASYATILHHSRKHAEDIVSISLALSNDSARIHSVQPLYTAGQVLGNNEDGGGVVVGGGGGGGGGSRNNSSSKSVDNIRICVLNLLQNIQRETGWATEYRMRHLLEQWGLPPAASAGEVRSTTSPDTTTTTTTTAAGTVGSR